MSPKVIESRRARRDGGRDDHDPQQMETFDRATRPLIGDDKPDRERPWGAWEYFPELGISLHNGKEHIKVIVIRENQMEVFLQATRAAFETEMVVHSKNFSPRLCEVIGDEQLRIALRQAMNRADGYGFTNRGPVRLFIELMFLFGSGFDSDPQYPWAAKILQASGDQMHRSEQMYEKTLEYQDQVSGPDAANTRAALKELSVLARQPFPFPAKDFVSGMLQEMTRVFPQKAAYVGEEGLTALIHEGRAEARQYSFPEVRADAMLVVLMFAFGHGCTDDPLYPWIVNTLKNDKITDPAARAGRLEKKAVTWLEHVLARFSERA